jgi:transposase
MVNKKEEEMHERTTNPQRKRETKEIYPSTEAPSSQGMGRDRERHRGCPEVSNPSPNPLSLEESFGTGGSDFSERQEASRRSSGPKAGEGESEAERGLGSSDPRIDALKKRDELGLTNRLQGQSYSLEQRQRIIQEVQKLHLRGLSKSEVLKSLGVRRSTYYGWLQNPKASQGKSSSLELMPMEREAVIQKKQQEPQWSHRQISGVLRPAGHWISPSTCYRILKPLGCQREWNNVPEMGMKSVPPW